MEQQLFSLIGHEDNICENLRPMEKNMEENEGSKVNSSKQKAPSLRKRLSRKIHRLSSLNSSKTDSSIEMADNQPASIDAGMLMQTLDQQNVALRRANRAPLIRNPVPIRDEEEEEDDDETELYEENQVNRQMQFQFQLTRQPSNSNNYQHQPMMHRERPQNQEPPMNNYEDLYDDRQGMNCGETHSSCGGGHRGSVGACSSIMSDLLTPDSPGVGCSSSSRSTMIKGSSRMQGGRKGAHHHHHHNSSKTTINSRSIYQASRRSKSPSSGSRRGQARKRLGLFGLASRLKLTRRHESIVKIQLSILQSGLMFLKRLDDPDFETFLPQARMTPDQFKERVKLISRYPVLGSIEYAFANRYEQYSCKHAQHNQNQLKNTSKKYLPYDYNRVVLKTLPNKPHSDYINASQVDTYLKPNAYIAAMGPNEQTIEDFWRMVWEQKSFVIIMLTKVFDFIKIMCNQYWPVELKKPERFGNLEVTLMKEEPLADFVIRTFRLTKCRPTQAKLDNKQNKTEEAKQRDTSGEAGKDTGEGKDGDCIDEHHEEEEEDVSDEQADDSGSEFGSDLSEEVVLNSQAPSVSISPSPHSALSIPPVRSPKFVLARQNNSTRRQAVRSRHLANRRRSISADNIQLRRSPQATSPERSNANNNDKTPAMGPHKQPSYLNLGLVGAFTYERSQSDNIVQQQHQTMQQLQHQRPLYPNQMSRLCEPASATFLHPLYGLTGGATSPFGSGSLSGSSLCLASNQPGTPASPMTPTTPSSAGLAQAGLDRSSATRRAVKKRRRAHVPKNTRPSMTQFQAPDEAQLADDDDDDDVDNDEDDADREACEAQDARLQPPGRASPNHNYLSDAQAAALQAANDASGLINNNTRERTIYQFHYHNWTTHTCPFISSLLHFRRRVRICMDEMSKSGKTGPSIVHCSDGCGRTGTYLCIDANLELAEEDGMLDVYNYTKKLRQSRKNLIDNEDQYKFVYDTIEESLFCGKTWFSVNDLQMKLQMKSKRNPTAGNKNEYQLEYEKICRMTGKFSIGDCAGGHRVENREKNRDVSTVPPDNFRPYLTSFQSNENTDYINAVFVDGYSRSKEYIVTEWPMHRTMSDFWSLVYDHDCNSVILLANPQESSTYPSFLPSEKELRRRFGPVFSAEMVSYIHYQNIKSWIYTINKKIMALNEVLSGVKSENKTTQVFQLTCWPQGHKVPTSTTALVELMNMVERWRARTAYGPVCVVSLNGKSRAGVYCAANVAIEQVVQHGEVDVFHAVKTVRRHRPQLIENMTEYKYCYDLIRHYVHYFLKSP